MAVCWASTPDRASTLLRGFDSRHPLQNSSFYQRLNVSKKFYHIPLQQILEFIKTNKADINKLNQDNKILEYHKLLGKSYYLLQIEEFIHFFKIDKDLRYALNTIEYFNSKIFVDEVYKSLNFVQFSITPKREKDFFYAFCTILYQKDSPLFEHFMHNMFLHYHTAFNNTSTLTIDYKEMALALLKAKSMDIKESFGEETNGSYFTISLNNKIVVQKRGRVIKTLRKKAYRELFFYLIDGSDQNSI